VNDTSVFWVRSFFYRHSPELGPSIVDADASMDFIESALPAELQHEHGFLRSMSCPAASRLLFPIAQAMAEMTIDLFSSPLTATEAAALANSSDPADLHKLAVHELSAPYSTAIESVKRRLTRALEQGHRKSAARIQ
jgi:hypothetical protein